ncbi:MAG: adenosylmethionine--8-amino-7-oxononanoate transaminase [Polyangiaceae bacterium]
MTTSRRSNVERADVVALDKRYVWHPYTQMSKYAAPENDPFVVDHAAGPYLFDRDGKRYIDANSSWWVAVLGHNHPRLVRALADQAATLCHASLAGVTHAPAALLAERLAAVAPRGLEHVFFSDDGSTAIEAALKMALGYHRQRGAERTLFVALGDAFHGETLGVTALGGVELFRRPFEAVLMKVAHVRPPAATEGADGAAAAELRAFFEERGADVAAMVVEPLLQGASGMNPYPAWYLRLARELCDRSGALLVSDEVFTGYGRVGAMWACSLAGVVPDIVCTAKGFSGGMLPMAATLANDRVFDAFLGAPERAFFYGHSFTGNPLGARVALEVLDVFEDEGVLAGIPERARRIAQSFERLTAIAGVSRPRSIGMVGAVNVSESAAYLGGAGWRVHTEARARGLYLRPLGDVVYIAPPVNIPLDALDELLSGVEASLRAAL